MAAKARAGFHGRAPCGGHYPRRTGRSRAIESVSFPAIVQAFVRGAATSLLDGAEDRTRKALLANPGASITGIALDVGFSETSAFSGAFRRVTGLTPTA